MTYAAHFRTPSDAVATAIHWCSFGQPTFARGLKAREILNPTLIINEPTWLPIDLDGRVLNHFIGAAEAAQLIGQTSRPEFMIDRIRKMASYTDAGMFHGAYGTRIAGDLSRIVALLKDDQASRQAVLSVYDARRDLGERFKDIPCTLTLQFLVRDGGLCLRTSMRSNDVWLGLPYDLFQFITLQMAMAQALDIPVSWYAHTVGSMHLYETNAEDAKHVVSRRELSKIAAPYFSRPTIAGISETMRRLLDDPRRDMDLTGFETQMAEWLAS